MIRFINYINKDFERQFEPDIKRYYREVRKLLPTLPKDIQIYFKSDGIIHGMFTGGYAYSPEIISIAVDPKATDLNILRSELRATVYHEAFHVAHNYTGQTGQFTLIQNALQEGSATVFEIRYANSIAKDLYANHGQHSKSQLNKWLNFILGEGVNTHDDYRLFAFYDKSDGIRWKLYKTGVWIVEKYLAKNNIDIKDLTNEDIQSIIESLA